MSANSSHHEPAESGIWHSLNRFLMVLIAVTVATVIGYRYMPELGARKELELRIEKLNAQIDHERQLLARYTREEKLLKSDPEYIGLIARDRLDLMKEGEVIYRNEPSKLDASKMRLRH